MNRKLIYLKLLSVFVNLCACDESFNDCHVNSSTWNTIISTKLESLNNLFSMPLKKILIQILSAISQKCPNLSIDSLNSMKSEVFCTLSKYQNLNRTMFIKEMSLNLVNGIANVLESKVKYNYSPTYFDKCMSVLYNLNSSILSDSSITKDQQTNFSIDLSQLYTNVSNLLNDINNETNPIADFPLYVEQNILKIIGNTTDDIRQNILNITRENLKKYNLRSEIKRMSCSLEISSKIVGIIENSNISLNSSVKNITYPQQNIESVFQKKNAYEIYANIFERFESLGIDFDGLSIFDIKSTIITILKNNISTKSLFRQIKRNLESTIIGVISLLFRDRNSKLHANCAFQITKRVIDIANKCANCSKFEIDDVRQFNFIKHHSYEIEHVKKLMLNFIIVSHKILEKYEKKLSGIISGILNEYKEKGIELNFKTIVDKIYSATENTIINSHIVNNLQFYFFNGPSENITSLRQSQLIMQIVLKYLPLDYQEIKIILLERMIFHILLEHNFDCNNFNRTVLMNDIIENIEYILNEKQELGIENDKLISQISVNFTLIEEDLIIALIESVQEYNNTILSVIISEISNKLLNTIPLEKFSCTIMDDNNEYNVN